MWDVYVYVYVWDVCVRMYVYVYVYVCVYVCVHVCVNDSVMVPRRLLRHGAMNLTETNPRWN